MKTAIILMTALVPTIGHKALIDFAQNFVGPNGFVQIIISSRSHEPVSGAERFFAFREEYGINHYNTEFFLHQDDSAPQNPSTPEEWNYWRDVCKSLGGAYEAPIVDFDFFISSEPYGAEMAKVLDCEFIPFDPDRYILDVKGTDVRDNLDRNFSKIMPAFRKLLQTKITFFGQESTGKTTMATNMMMPPNWHADLHGTVVHEFARPYLEIATTPDVTRRKMDRIAEGQYALQKTAYDLNNTMFVYQDTDLLSTIGYYRIFGCEMHPKIMEWFEKTKSDLYFVMNDDIPFERDILRYGGDKRESSKKFWIDLLEEHNCKYHIVEETDRQRQYEEVFLTVQRLYENNTGMIRKFVRE